MQVELDNSVIEDVDLLEEVYYQLKAFRKKHRISYASYLEVIRCETVPDKMKEAITALFQQTSTLIKFKYVVRVVKTIRDKNDVLVDDLNDVLSSKALVILENEHQDLEFIKIALESVKTGPDLNRQYEKLWAARGAGGCGDIPKLISKCSGEQRSVTRLLVVNDSDKYRHDYELQIAQINIQKEAQKYNASHVMLAKREIENYIPISVLEKVYSPLYPKIQYFKSWNKEQRNYFDMKQGFHKNCKHDDERYSKLYVGLISTHISAFEKGGFGEDVAAKSFNMAYKNLYTRENLDLLDKDIHIEFTDIKNKLLDIL